MDERSAFMTAHGGGLEVPAGWPWVTVTSYLPSAECAVGAEQWSLNFPPRPSSSILQFIPIANMRKAK